MDEWIVDYWNDQATHSATHPFIQLSIHLFLCLESPYVDCYRLLQEKAD